MANQPTYEELEQRIKGLEKEVLKGKQVEEALRESEKKYRTLFEGNVDGILITDIETKNYKYANPAFCKLVGYSEEEIKNLGVSAMHPKDKLEYVISELEAHVKGQKTLAENIPFLRKDGTIVHVDITGNLAFIDGKNCSVGFLRDITDHKQVEEELKKSEKKYKTLTDSSLTGIFIHQDGKYVFFNDRFAEMHGCTPEELLGKDYRTLIHPDEREAVGEIVTKRLAGKPVPNQYEVRRLKKDGETIWCDMMATAVDYGGRSAIMGNIINITERKRAEEHIRTLTQQLIKTQENERRMISGELHDRIGQDLSMLKIGCDTLFDNQPEVPPEVSQRASELSKILQRSIMSVRDLAYDLRPSGLDQLGLVHTIFQYCEDFSEKTGLKVDFNSAGMDEIKLDFNTEINLYRLVQEGLGNIMKHADTGQAIIRLVASHPNIILRIEDNGKGFDVKDRLAAASREKRMGLRGMEERVSLLEGKMRIQSRPTKGAKIFIEVPNKEKS
jgi:PAS domain S-box-containing protein